MGRPARAGVLAVALAIVASLLLGAGPAAAQTTVTSDGNVVTFTVKIDVAGAKGKKAPDGQTSLVDYWKQAIADTWGEAFGRLPYKNCYKFELDLKLKARPKNASSRDGRHLIHLDRPGAWENAGFAGVPETSPRRSTGDGTRSFEHGRDGTVPVNAPPVIVAHEFGHLLGLGDDRKGGTAKRGREGTLMVGGAEEGGLDPNQPYDPSMIDQNLIDRIGDLIREHLKNEDKKLPKCETWTATLSMSLNLAGICDDSAAGEGRLSVVDGAVTANFTQSGRATCPLSGSDLPASMPFELTGTFEDDEFELLFFDTSGAGIVSGQLCFVEPAVVGVDSPGSASAEWTWDHPAGGTAHCQMTLEREEEEPAVG